MKSLRGLTRIDHPPKKTHGWMVRLIRGTVKEHQFFSDKKYGGKRKARDAAAERYAELLKTAPPPTPVKNRRTTRNKTGKVGVRLAHDVGRRSPGNEYYSYVAFWTQADGRPKTIKFSTHKYGEESAFLHACLARDHEVAEREDVEKLFAKTYKKGADLKAQVKALKTPKATKAPKAVKAAPAPAAPAKKAAKKAVAKKVAVKKTMKLAKTAKAVKVAKKAVKKAAKKA
jgi:hypothetical protein